MKEVVYGLDFGTTNSAIAIFRPEGTKVLTLPTGSRTMRSVMFFSDALGRSLSPTEGCLVGEDAIVEYVNCGMRGRLIQSIKSILPDTSFRGTYVTPDTFFSAEHLVSIIIRRLKKLADSHIGREVHSVVLGRPARFSDDPDEEAVASERLVMAAHAAGFEDVRLQIEPIAAALTFEESLTSEKLVLVADFGGGTSDFTIMRLSPDRVGKAERGSDIVATRGVAIGGDAFNSLIMRHNLTPYFGANSYYQIYHKPLPIPVYLMSSICEWRRAAFLKNDDNRQFIARVLKSSDQPEAIERLQVLIEENLIFSLFQEIEEAKCKLSESTETNLSFRRSIIEIEEPISRRDFEELIEKRVGVVSMCLGSLLRESGVDELAIDVVFITGGTSKVPRIERMLSDKFGAQKIVSGDTFTSVARGLALSASYLF